MATSPPSLWRELASSWPYGIGEGWGDGLGWPPVQGRDGTATPSSPRTCDRQQRDAP